MSLIELRKVLILRKPRSGCLEERTAPIQPLVNFFTASKVETISAMAPAPCSLPGAGFAGVTGFSSESSE
jgi:hypothetical protein